MLMDIYGLRKLGKLDKAQLIAKLQLKKNVISE